MQLQSGTVWSGLLKSAVLCMNSTVKRSHGNTPFRVMWGRDSRHEDLVPVVNGLSVSSKEDLDMEGDILDQYDPILDEFHSENITVPAYLDQPEVLDSSS